MLKNKKTREGIAFLAGILLILALIEAGSALKGDRLVFPDAVEIGRAFYFEAKTDLFRTK